jgi:DNA-binding NtrC family response regulator
MAMLRAHGWPGNVRELAHAVERAVILTRGPIIQAQAFDLPRAPHNAAVAPSTNGNAHSASESAIGLMLPSLRIADAERLLIEEALAAANQNRTRAADLLGISVRTLRNKLNRPEDQTDA